MFGWSKAECVSQGPLKKMFPSEPNTFCAFTSVLYFYFGSMESVKKSDAVLRSKALNLSWLINHDNSKTFQPLKAIKGLHQDRMCLQILILVTRTKTLHLSAYVKY